MTTAYPLQWPAGFSRHKLREKGQFKVTLAAALANVKTSLERFGKDSGKKVESIVLSSNVTLGNDRPADPGIAVWFVWDGLQVCIPVDRYQTAEANLQAIYHIIEARRTELRHGTLALVRATFMGFKALPSPSDWRAVLGLNPNGPISREGLDSAYRIQAKRHHPDAGGTAEDFQRVQDAYAQGKAAVA
jgi:hypothetical protein